MMLDHNSTKGGVDNLDKVTSTYSYQRKTSCWPLVVFCNILDVSVYNAFDHQLLQLWLSQVLVGSGVRPTKNEEMNTHDGKKRKTWFCTPSTDDRKTNTMCVKCKKFICRKHGCCVLILSEVISWIYEMSLQNKWQAQSTEPTMWHHMIHSQCNMSAHSEFKWFSYCDTHRLNDFMDVSSGSDRASFVSGETP